MLGILKKVEQDLGIMLQSMESWGSLYIDYHPPVVERLWMDYNDQIRVYLHKIHPCEIWEALFHPHPWESAVKIYSGSYEMGIGYGDPNQPAPPVVVKQILTKGSAYEMIDPYGWHYVRPIGLPSYSLMIAGKPRDLFEKKKATKQLRELSVAEKEDIYNFFRIYRFAL